MPNQLGTTREFLRLLCSKFGLVVTPGRRDVNVLIVRQREGKRPDG